MNTTEYMRICLDLLPTVITLPDVLGDEKATRKKAYDFAEALLTRPELAKSKRMYVLQHSSELIEDWAIEYTQLSRLYCHWVSFPRLLGHRRGRLVKLLVGTNILNSQFVHHFFGWNGNADLPFHEANEPWSQHIYTMDSSGPVWRGLHNWALCAGHPWMDKPLNMDAQDFAEESVELADYNLQLMDHLCRLHRM